MTKQYIGHDGKVYWACSNCGSKEAGAFNWGSGPTFRCFKCPPPEPPKPPPTTEDRLLDAEKRIEALEEKIKALAGV